MCVTRKLNNNTCIWGKSNADKSGKLRGKLPMLETAIGILIYCKEIKYPNSSNLKEMNKNYQTRSIIKYLVSGN